MQASPPSRFARGGMSAPLVLHITTGLERGGAEVMLSRLLRSKPSQEFRHSVISLRGVEPLGPEIESTGAAVADLQLSSVASLPRLYRLRNWVAEEDPAVVQTWMLHGNVLGGLGAAGLAPVVWGVHLGVPSGRDHGRATPAILAAERVLSHRLPTRIVSCSETSTRRMESLGYPADKITTIFNGFDTVEFAPDSRAYRQYRNELGVPGSCLLISNVGRDHPQKDYATFTAACMEVLRANDKLHVAVAGAGLDCGHPHLGALKARFPRVVHLLGPLRYPARLLAASDVFVSAASSGEAFPLVIGEAMATGIPVVVTDCGDSRTMVADTGSVVPSRSPHQLAAAILEIADLSPEERYQLGMKARHRVETEYGLVPAAERYIEVWKSAMGPHASR